MNTVVLLTMPLTSHDADNSAKCQMTEKSQVAYLFDHLEISNAVVLLMMPSVSCNANAGITGPKKSFGIFFQSS